MADEEFGRAVIRVDLDESEAEADARILGPRLQRALNRATRNIGRAVRDNIQAGLRAAAFSVQVSPDLADFAARVRTALAGQNLTIPVLPDLDDFATQVRRALAGEGLTVPVAPDLADFAARVRTALAGERLTIPVGPDLGEFAARVRTALAGERLTVPVAPDLADFAARVRTALAGQNLTIPVLPDLARLDAAIRGHKTPELPVTLVADFDRLDAAIRGHRPPQITVPVIPDLDRFDSALLTGLRSLQSINIPVVPDLDDFLDRIRAHLAGEEVSIRVVPDLDDLDDRIRRHNAPDVTLNADVDTDRFSRALSGLTGVAGRVGGALTGLLRFGAVGIAAAGAAQGVGALVAALAPAAGIIAAYPAAFAGAQVALGTFKLAVLGVSDALSAAVSGDAEAFAEAVEKLSPAAQKAVTAVRDLAPELKKVQQSVQESFFKQFSGDVAGAIKNLLPLRTQLNQVAAQLGQAASEGLKFAASQQASAPLKQIIEGTAQAASGLQVAIAPLAKGFLDVAAAVSKAFGAQVGAGIGQVGAQVGTFLSEFAASGRAVEVVRGALKVFQQLGRIASNVGGILSGVFEAANAAGGGLLNNLETITASFEKFVESAQGQEAIGAIFGTVAQIAAQLGPILGALVTQVGAIAPALGPIFTALGPALVGLINSLGPALAAVAPSLQQVAFALSEAFAALGPSLGPLGGAVAAVVTALAPLLPLAAQIAAALASALGPALTQLGTALGPLVSQLSMALGPVIGQLGTLLGTVLTGALQILLPLLPPVVDAITGILGAASPLLPILTQVAAILGQTLGSAAQQLAPLLASVGLAATTLVAALAPLVGQILLALAPLLTPIVAAFNALVAAVVPLVPPIVGLVASIAPLVGLLIQVAAPILQFVAALASLTVINVVVPLITGIVSALTRLASILTAVVGGVTGFVQQVVGLFRSLYNTLVGNSIIPDLVNGIVRFFASLPGRILGAIRGLVSSVAGVFRSMASAALSAISSFISQAVSFLRGLPGKAAAALSGAKTALVSAGGDLISGMISGLKAKVGSLVSAARNVVGSAVSAAKNALGISSPSKVFKSIGVDVGRGLVIGLDGTAAQVRAASKRVADGVVKIGRETGIGFVKGLTGTASGIKSVTSKLANDIASTFRGVRTTVDDRLITLVQLSNERLQKLVVQRDAIAKRLAEAQKFAADTTRAALSAFSLQNLAQGQDGAVTVQGLVSGLKSAVFQVKQFDKQVKALAGRGLRKDLLEQVIGLGPQQGAALAAALSQASGGTLKQVNALQAQLAAASTKLGTDSADVLFDAGKQAGRGFLEGLKGQQKAIEALMLDIARGMQRAIRTALKIKSPSQVFADIGGLTGEGLEGGFLERLAALQDAARTAAQGITFAVASELERLPALVAASLGTLGAQIIAQIKSGLPAQARSFIPGFAEGGVVDSPVLAMLGEGGKREVVIPLTRPQRARQLADESGLTDILARAGKRPKAGAAPAAGTVHHHTWNITESGNARATAHRVVTRLALASGGL